MKDSKKKQTVSNHELWYQCRRCGKWFDRYVYGDTCPDCGAHILAGE